MNSDEGGLRRWARRKAEVRQGRGAAAPVLEEEADKVPALSEPEDLVIGPEGAAESQPDDLALPDVESLTADSDFSVFMKEGVPPALRRLALRKLWASDPMFNIIDEMIDYGGDFTNAATVVDGMQSAWVAGRGYAKQDPPTDEPVSDAADLADDDEAEIAAAVAETDDAGEGGDAKDAEEDVGDEETDLG